MRTCRLPRETSICALAARHVARRAKTFAEVCRTGKLPANRWCYAFANPAPLPDSLPRPVRAAWNTLLAKKPVSLSSRG